ncbi:MAG: hypothetical protein OEZ47_14215 [Gammaproteobacteria bacterium]|nr:hypothetical protein [Gammaproteobacteria bacterium]
METKNKSLLIIPVTCHMCGAEHIPHLSLQRRTMEAQNNIFGVPQYIKALPGKDFCDYNLIRVTICPKCFFSSAYIDDFISESNLKKEHPEPFDKAPILRHWLEGAAKRREKMESFLENLNGEERSAKQALASYTLAICSCNEVGKLQEARNEKSRDYSGMLRSVNYMLTKAELLMAHKKSQDAKKYAKAALEKLKEIFPYLKRESSIKAGYLIGMLGLYFDSTKTVGQSLNFLREYEKNNKVRAGTDEHKALVSSLKKMTEAYQHREEYSQSQLNGFNIR